MAQNSKSTKEKAAAARAAALKQEKARQRRTNLLIGGGLLVVIALIIGGVVFASKQNAASEGGIDPNAALPKTVLAASSPQAFGFPVGTPGDAKSTVQIWEDFQCPICAQFEKAQGSQIEQLATDGKIYLVYRPATFLDAKLKQSNSSSARATAAWGCAIDGGVGLKYHNTVFANQPATEGDGYTDAQLLDFGKTAGLSGAAYDTFASCVGKSTYRGWAANSEATFLTSGVPGTPNVQIDGVEIPDAELGNAAAYIDANRKK